jgi:glutamate synthase (NADPH/NADH) small chain
MVLKAIGQSFVANDLVPSLSSEVPALRDGRIVVDLDRRTSLPRVFAGGDCVAGPDLTVVAVQDGKLAAAAIHRELGG